jgi:3-methyladenine DNA glycosylase AlkD
MGVSPGRVFPLAKKFMNLPLAELDELLDSPFYEIRLGAVSIMDFQARAKSTGAAHRKALFDLYMTRHDRINTWDLVDRAAPHVVGGYLADKPRDVLYRLAKSKHPSERRTAIVSTYYFIRAGDVADTFRISELLAEDGHDLVQKATGSWLREAGKKDRDRLVAFLERHARRMPRTMLRYATEKLDRAAREKFLGK